MRNDKRTKATIYRSVLIATVVFFFFFSPPFVANKVLRIQLQKDFSDLITYFGFARLDHGKGLKTNPTISTCGIRDL